MTDETKTDAKACGRGLNGTAVRDSAGRNGAANG